MDTFHACHYVNDLIAQNNEIDARNQLIKILDFHEKEKLEYPEVVNHLIRQTGLYPYLRIESAVWQDRFAFESFKVDIGLPKPITLHREQSSILKKLLQGQNLAISAPTSFGKSFVIDSFIAAKRPNNIVIIVPTIALTDETRRRLHQKFSDVYKIITTTDVQLSDKNIFIFPQERAINYVDKIDEIDMLVVDEFYKASKDFDKERAPSLIRAIIKLGDKAKQKYFLAPHISTLSDNPFTRDMEFIYLDFNTVYLEKHDLFREIRNDENKKSEALLKILKERVGKTLIYAGTYSNIDKVANLIIANMEPVDSPLLTSFQEWLTINYDRNWQLTNLVGRGVGIHNGQLHRSLSQIQVKLFEEDLGINWIISTSSIIEGVNTSAENVVIWRNRNGRSRINDFTFKNIIGRGGRMFRHFVGNIFILEAPPTEEATQLDLPFPDEIIGDIDEESFKEELSSEQIAAIISYKEEMGDLLGDETFKSLQKDGAFQSSDSTLIRDIARDIKGDPTSWRGLGYLNSNEVGYWDRLLYKIINLQPGGWGIEYNKFVGFIKILSQNWESTIPELLYKLDEYDIGVDDFFKLERNATYKFAALANDVNTIQKEILRGVNDDISPFISKISHAFLPSVVYQLEEYGLPRMISKKIQAANIINFNANILTLHQTVDVFKKIGIRYIFETIKDLDSFDRYILKYFYEGISLSKENNES